MQAKKYNHIEIHLEEGQSFKFAQLSDLHFFAQHNSQQNGAVHITASSKAIKDALQNEEVQNLILAGDIIECNYRHTGLKNDEKFLATSQKLLENIIKQADENDVNVYFISGNHDDASIMINLLKSLDLQHSNFFFATSMVSVYSDDNKIQAHFMHGDLALRGTNVLDRMAEFTDNRFKIGEVMNSIEDNVSRINGVPNLYRTISEIVHHFNIHESLGRKESDMKKILGNFCYEKECRNILLSAIDEGAKIGIFYGHTHIPALGEKLNAGVVRDLPEEVLRPWRQKIQLNSERMNASLDIEFFNAGTSNDLRRFAPLIGEVSDDGVSCKPLYQAKQEIKEDNDNEPSHKEQYEEPSPSASQVEIASQQISSNGRGASK